MKNIRRLLCLIFLSLGISMSLYAQNKTIHGVVRDASDVIIGASVVVSGNTTLGTITDMDGKFTLSVPANSKEIIVSYVGYDDQKVALANQTNFNIVLKESSLMLEEVVAIGYAKVKRKDLTGASVSVGGNDLKTTPVTTAAQALAGKAAGVNIVTQSGAPGSGVNITVRGGTSITQGTAPLYIVDGFQMEDGLQNIDINDIETIDVMKDASATAIYGARGSNGVILITTKSGKTGKTEITYNAYLSAEKLGKKLDVLNALDYVKYQYEFQNLNGNEAKFATMFGGDVTAPDFYTGAYSRIQNEYGNREGIDWQDLVFGSTALTQNHNFTISGGTDKTKFMVSYNYAGQEGIMAKHDYRKNSIRAKINHEIAKGIRFDFSSSFQGNCVEGGGSLGGTLKMTILQPVTGGIVYTNDQLINSDISDEMSKLDSQYDVYNPLITNDAVTNKKYNRIFTTNAGLEFDLMKNLTFRTAGSYMWSQTRSDYWDDGRTKTAENNKGPYGYRNNSENYSWQITNTLNYSFDYKDDHHFGALLGQETYYKESMGLSNEYHEFPEGNFGLNDVNMGTAYSKSSSKDKLGLVSVFGRINYNYLHRYLLSATLRSDGSSKFARGNQWGYFPSASAAWRISEENFMKDVEFVNNLKLRLGYGTSGNNDISSNMYSTSYQSGHYALNNKDYITFVPGDVIGNSKLKWEKTTSTNIGLDVSFFNSRINLTVDAYNNESNNLLVKSSIPTSTGYSSQYQNIGSFRNRGIEFVVNSNNIRKKDFSWTTDFNISFNRSKVLELYGGHNEVPWLNSSDNIVYRIAKGEPLGQFYGYKYDGVYTTDDFIQNANGTYSLKDGVARVKGAKASNIKPGDVKYKTTAGNVDADGNPVWSTDDRVVIGNAQPKFTGGINNTFNYKGFDFSVFCNFVYGNKIFNKSAQRFIGPYLPNQNTLSVMNDRFTLIDPITGKETTNLATLAELNPNQYSKTAMWSLHSDNKIAITDPIDYHLEDGSYLRLSTITLGYTLPKELIRKAFLKNARIYCTLSNIYTFTNYSGYDPEVSASSSALTPGIDNSSYPRAKSYVVGVNLTF